MLSIFLLVVLLLFTACTTPQPDTTTVDEPAVETEEPMDESLWKDGVYTATFDHTDGHGWRPKLEITVEGSKITGAWMDYVKPDGSLKSEDSGYAEKMKAKSGTAPSEAYESLNKQVVEGQTIEIDALTGATHSLDWFHTMSKALMIQIEAGNATELVLPMNDVYKASNDAFDSHGWKGTIAITYVDGLIAIVEYNEVNEEGVLKTEDTEYQENFMDKKGVDIVEAYNTLQEQLVGKQNPKNIDIVSGATHATENFIKLVEDALANRVPYEIEN